MNTLTLGAGAYPIVVALQPGRVYGTHVNSKDLIKELLKDGWVEDRVNGSHHIFKHPVKPGHLSVPHPKKDLGAGLVAKLKKAAGL